MIVAKALEVDSAAKYAEKERKARTGEKRSKEKSSNASMLIPAPNFAGASATVIANYTPGNITIKKRNSQEIMLSPTSSLTANSSLGSTPGSAISSPTISTKVVNYQQTFLPSTANACAQLLSANISTPLSKTISITSVAPPPHSPSPNLISESASNNNASLNTTLIQDNYSTYAQSSISLSTSLNKSLFNETGFISNSASFIQAGFPKETPLSECTLKTDGNAMVLTPQTTMYVPLSSRTVMENLQFSLPSLSSTPLSKSSLNDPTLSKNSNKSTIKLERDTPDRDNHHIH